LVKSCDYLRVGGNVRKMANYQRCKIRVYPISGEIYLDNFKKKVQQLQIENDIFEDINIFFPSNMKFGEIHFTTRRYPYTIDKIFNLEENDLWIIQSDEGGSMDSISFETINNELFDEFHDKVLYSFDAIKLVGNPDRITKYFKDIFGFESEYLLKHEAENGILFLTEGLFTANNFFYGEEQERKIIINTLDDTIKGDIKCNNCEFGNIFFFATGAKFLENFYHPQFHNRPSGINVFPYLEKIEFYNKKKLSNLIDWSISCWQHSSDNGFWNCTNPKFYAYELLKK
jgi:hypothetical protein